MTRARKAFQRNKELSDKWGAIANSNWFEEVLAAAQSEMWELSCSDEQAKGARLFIAVLQGLVDTDAPAMRIPGSGIVDDMNPIIENVRNKKN